jgi:hypothetical protein
MKHQWLAYIIVGLLSIAAGVAIAGIPDNVSVDATIVVISTTEAPEESVPATTESASTTVVETTVVETTDPTTTSSTSPTSTVEAPSTTVEPTLPDRADIIAVTANGSGQSGVAAANAARLEAVGYTDVRPRDGTTVVDLTVVYYADGFEEAAVRMAADLDLLPEFVGPLAEAPEVLSLPADAQLVAYIGLDRA